MTLKEALLGKGYSEQETIELIAEMKDRVNDGENPEEVLFEEGFETDYVFDLLSDI